jgi:hypothetical protein
MVTLGLVGIISLAAGFGLGRVKNASKLSAIKSEIIKAENSTVFEVKEFIATIKAKL